LSVGLSVGRAASADVGADMGAVARCSGADGRGAAASGKASAYMATAVRSASAAHLEAHRDDDQSAKTASRRVSPSVTAATLRGAILVASGIGSASAAGAGRVPAETGGRRGPGAAHVCVCGAVFHRFVECSCATIANGICSACCGITHVSKVAPYTPGHCARRPPCPHTAQGRARVHLALLLQLPPPPGRARTPHLDSVDTGHDRLRR
jgi:hypothetical protein